LLAITYELVAHTQGPRGVVVQARAAPGSKLFVAPVDGQVPPQTAPPELPVPVRQAASQLQAQANAQIATARQDQLDALLTRSGIGLGIMAVVSVGLGWLMAGRALRPVRTMSERARGISERNLHERLAVAGPDDELKELGETFDALLGRLQAAFESQRRFVANASHELRTPITLERTLVEVALADPEADVDSLRATCERVLAASEQQERMIEALLTLARSQRGLTCRQDVDLGEIAQEVIRSKDTTGLRVKAEFGEAPVLGDQAMLERLVANLVDNAVRYNVAGGELTVWTGRQNGSAGLRVSNTGPPVPAAEVEGLLEPFRRLNAERTGEAAGLGLGLSIVAAIAEVHDASLQPRARPEGGLDIALCFPATEPEPSAARRAPDLVTLP
ncbi:MAG TPA: ATP-binding protein, partial [Solirubrobacteraceae bacterium]|nr:ATP-binding protein [Solirubrobacteraceae bacterium]